MTEEDLIKQIGGYKYRCRRCGREWKSIWKLRYCTCGTKEIVVKILKAEEAGHGTASCIVE